MNVKERYPQLCFIGTGWGLPEHLATEAIEFLKKASVILMEPGTEVIIDSLPFLREKTLKKVLQIDIRVATQIPSEGIVVFLFIGGLSDRPELLSLIKEAEKQGFYTSAVPGITLKEVALTLLKPSVDLSVEVDFQRLDEVNMKMWAFSSRPYLFVGRTLFGSFRLWLGLPTEAEAFLKAYKWAGPIFVIGPFEGIDLKNISWYPELPLYNKRIVITRARAQAPELLKMLRSRGADVIFIPSIKVEYLTHSRLLNEIISGLNVYDWIIFTSANGVDAFFERFFQRFSDMRDFGGARIAAVGPITAQRIKDLKLTVDLVPKEISAQAIAEELSQYMSIENLRILLVRGEHATPDLPKILEEKGAIVDDIACYKVVEEPVIDSHAIESLEKEGADWILFFSGSSVEYFNKKIDLRWLTKRFPNLKIGVIGPQPRKILEELGIKPEIEAFPHTVEALISAIEAKEVSQTRM